MLIKSAIFGALALAFACFASPVLAQDAARPEAMIAIAVQRDARIIVPLRRPRENRRVERTELAAPLDIRTPSQLLAEAQRYVGARRFTHYARAWCADAMNAWLAHIGKPGTGDGRAISFARYGRPTEPKIGAIAVLRHHVGVIAGWSKRGLVLVSGNHGRRVGIGTYSARKIIAYREPV